MNHKDHPDFLAFWQIYPRKVAKITAFKAYLRALRGRASHQEILEGVEKYVQNLGIEGTETHFIAHPSSWLNGGRWADEYDSICTHQDAEEIKWRLVAEAWHKTHYWIDIYGPKPGQPGCKCPSKFLLESAA